MTRKAAAALHDEVNFVDILIEADDHFTNPEKMRL